MDVEETEDQVCYAANVHIQPDFDAIEAIGIEMLLPVLHVLFNNMRGYVVARAVYGLKHNYHINKGYYTIQEFDRSATFRSSD